MDGKTVMLRRDCFFRNLRFPKRRVRMLWTLTAKTGIMKAKQNEERNNMGKYTGVIFDLDGVICFTDKYHYQAWKAVAD